MCFLLTIIYQNSCYSLYFAILNLTTCIIIGKTRNDGNGNRNGRKWKWNGLTTSLCGNYALLNGPEGMQAHEVTEGGSGQSFNSGHGIHASRIPSVSKLSNAVLLLAKTACSQRAKTGTVSGNPLLSGIPSVTLLGIGSHNPPNLKEISCKSVSYSKMVSFFKQYS